MLVLIALSMETGSASIIGVDNHKDKALSFIANKKCIDWMGTIGADYCEVQKAIVGLKFVDAKDVEVRGSGILPDTAGYSGNIYDTFKPLGAGLIIGIYDQTTRYTVYVLDRSSINYINVIHEAIHSVTGKDDEELPELSKQIKRNCK